MNLKTPEERRASAQKAVATRRANLDRIAKAREEALVYADGLRIKIVALEIRLTELCQGEKMSTVSAALTNKALLTYEEIVKVALPWKLASGVYFLIQDDKVVYVGQSVNVYSRIAQHVNKQFDKYAFVPCDVDLLDKLESLYIHVLKPKLNGNLNTQEKSAPIRFNELLNMV